jgi:hypothetical protein
MPNCCDEYGTCTQAQGCPVRVAAYHPVMRAADPLPPSVWRDQLKRMACWVGLVLLGWVVWAPLAYLVLRE